MLLTPEQLSIRDTVQRYAREKLAASAGLRDQTKAFPHDELAELAEMGLMGMLVPPELGGAGLDYLTMALVLEELAVGDGSLSTIVSVNNSVVCGPLLQFGNDLQRERYLKPLASGAQLGCFCLTEPHTGSDAGAIKTKATRKGNHYILSGAKQFITSGKNAHLAIVLAVTDAAAGKRGISAFIVPTDTPGYVIAKVEDKLGQHSSDTAHIIFDNCKIPAANRLGAAGDGYKIALANLEAGRIGIAAQSVGMARAAYECALRYAKERKSFGQPIIQHQAVGFRLAEMATQIEAARQLIWHAAVVKDSGQPALKLASMAKLFASEMAEKVCSAAIQTLGGYGYLSDFPLERIYRDVRVTQIYEGTSDIQKLVISRALENE